VDAMDAVSADDAMDVMDARSAMVAMMNSEALNRSMVGLDTRDMVLWRYGP